VRLFEDAARRLHWTAAHGDREAAAKDSEGHEWFEWEDRPGAAPAANATASSDETLVHVCYVEMPRPAGMREQR